MINIYSRFYAIPSSPLFIPLILFIVGIIAQSNGYIVHMACLLFCLVCISCLYAKKRKDFSALFATIFFFLGAFLYTKNIQDHYAFYEFIKDKPITLTGTVINKSYIEDKWHVLEVAIDSVCNGTIKTSNKSALLYTKNEIDLLVADKVTFFKIYNKESNNESYNHYLIKEKVALTIFNKSPQYECIYRPLWSLRRFIATQKRRLLDALHKKLSPHTFRFFSSLFLGNRAFIKSSIDEINEQFKVWGLSHFLARSGLHLVVFILVWQAILSFIPLSFFIKQCFLSILSFLYFILTWTSAPFTRAVALFFIQKICLFFKIPFNLFHYLILVCFCFLIYCPLYLFFLDFQLSFILTFALAWFNHIQNQYPH